VTRQISGGTPGCSIRARPPTASSDRQAAPQLGLLYQVLSVAALPGQMPSQLGDASRHGSVDSRNPTTRLRPYPPQTPRFSQRLKSTARCQRLKFDMRYVVAFGGGSVSFLPPCVLPLTPAYLSLVTGLDVAQPPSRNASERAMRRPLACRRMTDRHPRDMLGTGRRRHPLTEHSPQIDPGRASPSGTRRRLRAQ
jgi:hypothetical protein